MSWICPYCGEPLPDEHAAHCGEVWHAQWEDDDESDYRDWRDIASDETGVPRFGPI